jgi:hypothetical protein
MVTKSKNNRRSLKNDNSIVFLNGNNNDLDNSKYDYTMNSLVDSRIDESEEEEAQSE